MAFPATYSLLCEAWRGSGSVYTVIVYTGIVLGRIAGFDWDAANVGHILRHAVTDYEMNAADRRVYAPQID